MVNCRLNGSATTESIRVLGGFEFPRVATLVVQQAWVVVSLVKVFEDTGKDLGFSMISSDGRAMMCHEPRTHRASPPSSMRSRRTGL